MVSSITRSSNQVPHPEWTITHALDVANVQGDSHQRIRDEFEQGDWKGVRTEFALWSLNEKAIAIKTCLCRTRARMSKPIPVVA